MSEIPFEEFSTDEEDTKPDISSLSMETDITEEPVQEKVDVHKSHHIQWHENFNKKLRSLINCEIAQVHFKNLFFSYLRLVKEHLPFLLRYPKRCRQVAKKMSKVLLLFRSFYSNTTEIDLYNIKMCELLSVLTTLELKYASNFDELKIEVVKRLCINYDIHLRHLDVSHILRVFLYLYYISYKTPKKEWTIFDQTEVLTKIFEKYLRKSTSSIQTKLSDQWYCMYLVGYYLWSYIETDTYEKNEIIKYANQAIAPQSSLRKNTRYKKFIPTYSPDQENVTKYILEKGFNRVGLVEALIADDFYEGVDVVINLCGSPQQQIIDLDEDIPRRDFENLQIYSEFQLETPVQQQSTINSGMASTDSTNDKEDDENTKGMWLDKLIRLKRQAKRKLRHPNKNSDIEIINLDDSDVDYGEEEEEEEENANANTYANSDKIEKNKEPSIECQESNNEEQVNNEILFNDKENQEDTHHSKDINQQKEGIESNERDSETETIEINENSLHHEIDANKKETETEKRITDTEKDELLVIQGTTEVISGEKNISEPESDTIMQTLPDNGNISVVGETIQKNNNLINAESQNKGDNDLTHINYIENLSANKSGATLLDFDPISDENLDFEQSYSTKTYSKKKEDKNKDKDRERTNDNGENEETMSEKNSGEESNDKSEKLSNAYNHEITSSTFLTEEYDGINRKQNLEIPGEKRKANSEKIVHRFFVAKKVNFAPLPEKHVANPKNLTKKIAFEKRFRKISSKMPSSFESQKDSSLLENLINSPLIPASLTKNNSQKSTVSSTVVGPREKSVDILDIQSPSLFTNLRTSSPIPTNKTSDSRPTAISILAATGVKCRGNSNVTGMNKNLNIVYPELNSREDKRLIKGVLDTLTKTVADTSVDIHNFNLYPDSTVGDDSIVLGCESDNNLSSNNANFNLTIKNVNNKKHDTCFLHNVRGEDCDNIICQILSYAIAIFSQNFLDKKNINFDREFIEEDEESNLGNVDSVKISSSLIQETENPADIGEMEQQVLNNTYDDSCLKDSMDNSNKKEEEVQTSLPLKKRRKLSTFNDIAMLRPGDIVDFNKIKLLIEDALFERHLQLQEVILKKIAYLSKKPKQIKLEEQQQQQQSQHQQPQQQEQQSHKQQQQLQQSHEQQQQERLQEPQQQLQEQLKKQHQAHEQRQKQSQEQQQQQQSQEQQQQSENQQKQKQSIVQHQQQQDELTEKQQEQQSEDLQKQKQSIDQNQQQQDEQQHQQSQEQQQQQQQSYEQQQQQQALQEQQQQSQDQQKQKQTLDQEQRSLDQQLQQQFQEELQQSYEQQQQQQQQELSNEQQQQSHKQQQQLQQSHEQQQQQRSQEPQQQLQEQRKKQLQAHEQRQKQQQSQEHLEEQHHQKQYRQQHQLPPEAIGSTYRRDPHTQRPRIANPETDLVLLEQQQQQQQQQQHQLELYQQEQHRQQQQQQHHEHHQLQYHQHHPQQDHEYPQYFSQPHHQTHHLHRQQEQHHHHQQNQYHHYQQEQHHYQQEQDHHDQQEQHFHRHHHHQQEQHHRQQQEELHKSPPPLKQLKSSKQHETLKKQTQQHQSQLKKNQRRSQQEQLNLRQQHHLQQQFQYQQLQQQKMQQQQFEERQLQQQQLQYQKLQPQQMQQQQLQQQRLHQQQFQQQNLQSQHLLQQQLQQKQLHQQQLQLQYPTIHPFIDGISYPSTPMLSIANFESMMAQHASRQSQQHHRLMNCPSTQSQSSIQPSFQLSTNKNNNKIQKLNMPVNLQTINILPTRHHTTIIENNINKTNTIKNYNILPDQTQTIVKADNYPTNNQTFNISPITSTNSNALSNIPISNSLEIPPNNIQMSSKNAYKSAKSNTETDNFDLNLNKERLPPFEALNMLPNSFPYMHAFSHHRSPTQVKSHELQLPHEQSLSYHSKVLPSTSNSLYPSSFQTNDSHSKGFSKSNTSWQDIWCNDMSNYNLNDQHLNNYIYNSRYNYITRQNVFKDISDNSCKQQQPNELQQRSLEKTQPESDIQHLPPLLTRASQEKIDFANQISCQNQHEFNNITDALSSSTLSLSTNQQAEDLTNKNTIEHSKAFLDCLSALAVNNTPTVSSRKGGKKTLINNFNETYFCQKNFILNDNKSTTELQKGDVAAARKRRSKITAEERITRASTRAKKKVQGAQKKIGSQKKKNIL